MSRDSRDDRRSRSRSRDRQARHVSSENVCNASISTILSLLKVSDVRSSEGLAADSWSDKLKSTKGQSKLEEDLAAQFGYTQNTWDSSRVAGMGSMSGWFFF